MKSKITLNKSLILLIRASIVLAMVMVFLMDLLVSDRVDLAFVFFCLLTLYFMSD